MRATSCVYSYHRYNESLYRIFIYAFIDRSNYYESGYNECVHYYHRN